MTDSETIASSLRQSPLFPTVLRIIQLLHDHGGQAYLVGGCVRDALFGTPAKDLDIEVYGLPQEQLIQILSAQFRLDTVGASFGVTKIHGLDIDIALPRRETKLGEGHKAFAVNTTPDLSVAEAASRRDLTINAILFNPLDNTIVDPWNGLRDLRSHTLRHVSEHFSEDPLRVLRIMQFAARLPFTVAPETVELCRNITPEGLPRERVGGEFEKLLLKGTRPSAGLRFLVDCGWIRYFPELQALVGCRQTPRWHPEGDVWNHTLIALDHAVALRHGTPDYDLPLMAAVLCHDLGKPSTSVPDSDGTVHCIGHDLAGVPVARTFLQRLWLNNDLEKLVLALVACHMRTHTVALSGSDRAMRRLAVDALRLDLLADLYECDLRASKPQPLTHLEAFREHARQLDVATHAPRPIVLGRHLIERGFTPGPAFRPILDQCFDAQLDGTFTDLDGGLRFLDSILDKHYPCT